MLRRSAEECLALADAVLAAVPHGEAEVLVTEDDLALTRFARNIVHQNVADTGLSLRLRLVATGAHRRERRLDGLGIHRLGRGGAHLDRELPCG